MYYPTPALDMWQELSKDKVNNNFKASTDSVTLKGKTLLPKYPHSWTATN